MDNILESIYKPLKGIERKKATLSSTDLLWWSQQSPPVLLPTEVMHIFHNLETILKLKQQSFMNDLWPHV